MDQCIVTCCVGIAARGDRGRACLYSSAKRGAGETGIPRAVRLDASSGYLGHTGCLWLEPCDRAGRQGNSVFIACSNFAVVTVEGRRLSAYRSHPGIFSSALLESPDSAQALPEDKAHLVHYSGLQSDGRGYGATIGAR